MTDSVSSGDGVTISHTWNTEGTYEIKAKSIDKYGAESNWATLEVRMPKNRAINTPFLNFLENFLHKFSLLRQVLVLQ